MDEFFKEISFPYDSVRTGQDVFIRQVNDTIIAKKNIMVYAPTGLGKTISALAPAIYQGKKENKIVICLTSRQTQANQIIKTIKDISNKSKEPINYVAFIGKRNMCVHQDIDLYPPQDFNDFCKKVRETGKCNYYRNFKDSDQEEKRTKTLQQTSNSFMDVEGFVNLTGGCKFCPYEMAGLKANSADVVICDYNYLFNAGIREGFLGKIGRSIEECIIIVDEAHNLPDRIRMSYSYTLSTEMIKLAIKELTDEIKSSKYDELVSSIRQVMEDLLYERLQDGKDTYLVTKEDFLKPYLERTKRKIEDVIGDLYDAGAIVKEDKMISHIDRVAHFLDRYNSYDEESYLRVLEKEIKEQKTVLSLNIKCIDPSDIAMETLNNSYSSILMSGTLSPIEMYRDILGVGNCTLLELESPFLKENQLILVDNEVTTKFTARSNDMYNRISSNVQDILNAAPKRNAIVFFPSYSLLEKITSFVNISRLNRKVLTERKFMTKEEKEKFVDVFKTTDPFNNKGKVLFAVTSGSFAEGLDLPDEALEMVIVVGLPLAVPDIVVQAIIRHFDKKFGKGQLYGYIHPALSKIVQAGGRCIRTETDRGVIALLDSRFLFPIYAQSLPKHWHLKVPQDFGTEIKNFFK